MHKRWIVAGVAVCVIFMNVSVASADEEAIDTANDLFSIYNEAQLEDFNIVNQQYADAVKEWEAAKYTVESAELHNELLSDAREWQNQERERIQGEIDALVNKNVDLRQQIFSNFNAPWDLLEQADKAHKINVSKINGLLSDYDKLSVSEDRRINYDILSKLTTDMEEMQKLYKDAVDVRVLGSVYNVHYPLSSDTIVTSKFGSRIDPISGTKVSYHTGLDLRASIGTEVGALFNGVVAGTGYTATGGYYVSIDHGNGIRSYYCHLSEILCVERQSVSQYEVIALSGNTGTRTTGPHLHMALYINGNPVDPQLLFQQE